jgi:hypothetical protein
MMGAHGHQEAQQEGYEEVGASQEAQRGRTAEEGGCTPPEKVGRADSGSTESDAQEIRPEEQETRPE